MDKAPPVLEIQLHTIIREGQFRNLAGAKELFGLILYIVLLQNEQSKNILGPGPGMVVHTWEGEAGDCKFQCSGQLTEILSQ